MKDFDRGINFWSFGSFDNVERLRSNKLHYSKKKPLRSTCS